MGHRESAVGANGASAIVLDRVSKSFDGVRAVQELSLRVPAGTIYGFLGPNGAGKTTTIRMIMDILRPDGGRIEVLGAASARQAKDRVGYMPEERGLYPRMKVRNVLAFLAQLKGVPKTEIPGRLESWLKAMDLSGWQQKEVRELSRGMQRRAEFIAAVISDPELIVMDEPFAGLDPLNLDLVKDTILRLRAAGKTIILSTHNMEQAETLCDRILLIHRGEKVLDGSLAEIRAPYESDAVVVELEGEAFGIYFANVEIGDIPHDANRQRQIESRRILFRRLAGRGSEPRQAIAPSRSVVVIRQESLLAGLLEQCDRLARLRRRFHSLDPP